MNQVIAFPTDPEQWIYAKARELESQMPKPSEAIIMYMTPEDKAITALEMEVHCLRQAIKAYSDLLKKFQNNPKNRE